MPIDNTHEFVALRAEILNDLKDVRALERYVLVASGAIWAWLIVHRVTDSKPWGIPSLLVILAGMRAMSIMQHLGAMGEYIREHLQGGYERFLSTKRCSATGRRRVVRFVSDYGSWICLFILSLAALYLGPQIVSSLPLLKCPVVP